MNVNSNTQVDAFYTSKQFATLSKLAKDAMQLCVYALENTEDCKKTFVGTKAYIIEELVLLMQNANNRFESTRFEMELDNVKEIEFNNKEHALFMLQNYITHVHVTLVD